MAITHPHPTNIANSHSLPSSKPNHNDKTNNQITRLPVTKADLPRIALLEHLAFEEDEFSDLAFGRERGSSEALKMRERQFEKFLDKAERGGEEEGDGIKGDVGSLTGLEEEEKMRIKTKEELEEIWGKGSNVQLCEDVFVRGAEYMLRACGGEKWLKLNILVIHPSHQRRGIGTLLLEQGLKLADEKSLQVLLGASPWGIGLYRKTWICGLCIVWISSWIGMKGVREWGARDMLL
ncbi:uncharacterized protein EAF02_002328 [Botrytis sinoallii]|uniref:uncharacterized protein n=1 Tax=Botrytis sinoallii TaxID=1463999 RepID=UPI001900EF64|nr:uncharacterized protein EAF02_002328 [Botrytis sinoallii]KAF7889913.1 hypothetical protein EAF02_002328 [Botrytis sinoallii]